MKILTAEEMAAADKRSIDAGVPVAMLMEHAGTAVAKFVQKQYPEKHYIVVLCGKGNNGGDGMVAARKLAEGARNVRVVLLGAASDLKGDAAHAWELAALHTEQIEIADESALRAALE